MGASGRRPFCFKRGVPNRAEIIPFEPDPVRTGGGTAMSDSSHIIVNGQARSWPVAKPLTEFLVELQLPVAHVAVAINDRIVPRAKHGETVVNPGDRVEIVQPVGGG